LCSLSDISSLLEKECESIHTASHSPKDEDAHIWLKRVAKSLHIRIAVINLAANLETPRCLVKYNPSIETEDIKSRGHIITAALVDALVPFEFPPIVIPPSSIFSDNARTHAIFGKEGVMFVFLDYRYGSRRYLPLQYDQRQYELPPTSSLKILRFASPKIASSDIGTALNSHHYNFMSHYLMPSTTLLANRILPSRGTLQYENPPLKSDIPLVAMRVARNYMKQFLISLEATRDKNIPHAYDALSSKRMHTAYNAMFEDKMSEAINSDKIEEIEMFSPQSSTAKIINLFEAHFLGLEK